MKRNIQIRSS